MKFKTFCVSILFISLIIPGLQAQDSTIFNQTTRLAALAKVWGFLKYYHSGVAEGTVDWDKVLVDSIEPAKAADTRETFNDVIGEMIRQAGNMNFLNYIHVFPEDEPEEPDFQWIEESSIFTWYTTLKLKAIRQFHRPVENIYVKYAAYAGNVVLDGEQSYPQMSDPSEEYKLLALFRYWNIIHYFFPYKYLIGRNWEDILTESIPIFINAGDTVEYHLAVCELTAKINDSHAYTYNEVLEEYWGMYFPPFNIRTIEEQSVVTYVYPNLIRDPETLKIGDIILKINDMPVETVKKQLAKYIGASNQPTLERNLNFYICRGQTNGLKLSISRNDREKEVNITRYTTDMLQEEGEVIDRGDVWKILTGNIGYINMGLLEREQVDDVMQALLGTRAIIFDVRNYPRGVYNLIANYLNPDRRTFAKITKPDPDSPGKFILGGTIDIGPASFNSDYYKGKVVVLINEVTQSHAEFTCMALQTAPDVTIIGSQTAGADGNVSYLYFPGEIITLFTGLGVYYPDGRETQRIGIVPDIEVKPTIKGIREGRDELLEKALEFINNS